MKSRLALFIISSSILWACKSGGINDCFKSTGSITTEDRFIGRMSAIELHDRINLHIRFANESSLQVRAGKNLLESIKTEMKGITLVIKNENKCNWIRSFKKEIDVFLTVPELKDFALYGSGEVNFIDTLTIDTFRLEMWDATGILNLKVNADFVSLKSNTGPGDVFCSGQTKECVGFNGGTGTVDAGKLIAKKASAFNANRGKLIINAQEQLIANISGSGNIEYFGSPLIDLKNTSSGQLIPR